MAMMAAPVFNDRRGAARGSRTTQFKPMVGGAPKPNDPAMGMMTGAGPKKPGQATRERAARMRSTHNDVQAGRAVMVTPFTRPSAPTERTVAPLPAIHSSQTRAAAMGYNSFSSQAGPMQGHVNASHAGFYDFSGGVAGGMQHQTPQLRSTPAMAPKPYRSGVIDRLANRFMSIKPISPSVSVGRVNGARGPRPIASPAYLGKHRK
jgi:hypothetical protein